MRRSFHSLFLLIFTIFFGSVYAQIEECSSLQQVLTVADPTQSQLIILDIDNTIYHPKQMLGSDEWFDYFLQKQQNEFGRNASVSAYVLDLWSSIQTISEVIPVEAEAASIIKRLQVKKCCVMSMTTRGPRMASATFRQLDSLKIDLCSTAPTQVRFQLNKYPQAHYGNGVLFTDGKPKGECLREFLTQIGWMPDQIIYINDKKGPLEEVATSLDSNVRYLGLRYSGADHFIHEFSPDIAETQLNCFENLLSNEAALLMNFQQKEKEIL